MFQLRSHLATLHNEINLVRIDILSIVNQVLVISLQKLKPALLKQSDLKSLLTKLENLLVLHPRLALSQREGEIIWYMYTFRCNGMVFCTLKYHWKQVLLLSLNTKLLVCCQIGCIYIPNIFRIISVTVHIKSAINIHTVAANINVTVHIK